MRKYYIVCDRCEEKSQENPPDFDIRYPISDDTWVNERGKDLCPTCYQAFRDLQRQKDRDISRFFERKKASLT